MDTVGPILIRSQTVIMKPPSKFDSQSEPETVEGLREIPTREGQQLQPARRDVRDAFQESVSERDKLYKLLAK